jgi:hypothetical protein
VGDIFRTRPASPCGPPNLLYSGYWVSSRGKTGRNVALTIHPSSSAEVKERVELYICLPPPLLWAFVAHSRMNVTFLLFSHYCAVPLCQSLLCPVRYPFNVNPLLLAAKVSVNYPSFEHTSVQHITVNVRFLLSTLRAGIGNVCLWLADTCHV